MADIGRRSRSGTTRWLLYNAEPGFPGRYRRSRFIRGTKIYAADSSRTIAPDLLKLLQARADAQAKKHWRSAGPPKLQSFWQSDQIFTATCSASTCKTRCRSVTNGRPSTMDIRSVAVCKDSCADDARRVIARVGDLHGRTYHASALATLHAPTSPSHRLSVQCRAVVSVFAAVSTQSGPLCRTMDARSMLRTLARGDVSPARSLALCSRWMSSSHG